MTDPFTKRDQLDAALELAVALARLYLERIGDEPVLSLEAEAAIERWSDPMPEDGVGSLTALAERGACAGNSDKLERAAVPFRDGWGYAVGRGLADLGLRPDRVRTGVVAVSS